MSYYLSPIMFDIIVLVNMIVGLLTMTNPLVYRLVTKQSFDRNKFMYLIIPFTVLSTVGSWALAKYFVEDTTGLTTGLIGALFFLIAAYRHRYNVTEFQKYRMLSMVMAIAAWTVGVIA